MRVVLLLALLIAVVPGRDVNAATPDAAYLTEFCRSILTADDLAAAEKIVADKAKAFAPLIEKGSLVYRTPLGTEPWDTREVWVVAKPAGAVASCSDFKTRTDEADPEAAYRLMMDGTAVAPSDFDAISFRANVGCGTNCGWDLQIIVLRSADWIHELIIGPITYEAYLAGRQCPLEFDFSANDIQFQGNVVRVGGSLRAQISCTSQEQTCTLRFPRQMVWLDERATAEATFLEGTKARHFSVTGSNEFEMFAARQDALVGEGFGSEPDEVMLERCRAMAQKAAGTEH